MRSVQGGQLWLPISLWALLALLCWLFRDVDQGIEMGRGFLGVVLPLVGGIMAAYAVLDDPALELQFATPRRASRMLLDRLGLVLVILTAAALTFQLYLLVIGVDLSLLGGLAERQLAWVVPCLAMTAFGSLAGFILVQPTPAALLVGLLWIFQFALRDWLAADRVGRYLLLYEGAIYPQHPDLRANQVCLFALAVIMLLAAWALLKKQERYI